MHSPFLCAPVQAYELSGHLTKQLNAQGLGESLMKPIILPQQVGRGVHLRTFRQRQQARNTKMRTDSLPRLLVSGWAGNAIAARDIL